MTVMVLDSFERMLAEPSEAAGAMEFWVRRCNSERVEDRETFLVLRERLG